MKKQKSNYDKHDECVEKVKTLFDGVGFFCILEDKKPNVAHKAPDLKCESEKMVIEIKTFQGNPEDKKREREILENNQQAYWELERHSVFSDQIKKARKKFQNYPDYKSIVFFVNFLRIDRQNIIELLFKEEYLVFEELNKTSYSVKDRIFTKEKNTEVGAIAQIYDDKLIIIHNSQADDKRKIPRSVGQRLGAVQKIYIYNPTSVIDYE